jgi:hypothetical protein
VPSFEARQRAADLALIAAGASYRVALAAAAADALQVGEKPNRIMRAPLPTSAPPVSATADLPLPPGSCDAANQVRSAMSMKRSLVLASVCVLLRLSKAP